MLDKEIKNLYEKECEDVDFSLLETDKEDLDKYSDKGRKYFIVYFSEIKNNKIIVFLASKKESKFFCPRELYFVYKIDNKKIESEEIVY